MSKFGEKIRMRREEMQLSQEQLDETVNGYVLHDKAEKIIMDSAVINNKPEE